MGPMSVPTGTLTRKAMEKIFIETECIAKLKEFKPWRGRELMVWGHPSKVSLGFEAALAAKTEIGAGGTKTVEEQDALRARSKASAAKRRARAAEKDSQVPAAQLADEKDSHAFADPLTADHQQNFGAPASSSMGEWWWPPPPEPTWQWQPPWQTAQWLSNQQPWECPWQWLDEGRTQISLEKSVSQADMVLDSLAHGPHLEEQIQPPPGCGLSWGPLPSFRSKSLDLAI